MIPFGFQDFGSFSLSLFEILSQVDSLSLPLLFGSVGISPVPLPAGYSSVSSSWLYCCVWGGFSIICGISSLRVGLYQWLVKVFWLGRHVLEFWWVQLDFFSLECNEVSSNEL